MSNCSANTFIPGGALWCPHFSEITAHDLARARELELCVAVWTVNEPADINAMIDLRVDAIVTDYPGRVHDANLIEAPLDAIDQHVERATHEMQKVSGWVLGRGSQCRVDAEIVRWPGRYIDGRGADMWSFIQQRLGEEAA